MIEKAVQGLLTWVWGLWWCNSSHCFSLVKGITGVVSKR